MTPDEADRDDRPEPPIRGTDSALWRTIYGLLCAAGWVGFGWAWYVVFYKRTPQQTLEGVIALAIFLLFVVVVTLAWMRHNIVLHRRKGPRSIIPLVTEDWSHDRIGRPVSADWAAVKEAELVIVEVTASGKTYTPQ
jgi:hypothetical protein